MVLLNTRVVSPSGQGSINFHLMLMLIPKIGGGRKTGEGRWKAKDGRWIAKQGACDSSLCVLMLKHSAETSPCQPAQGPAGRKEESALNNKCLP